MKVFYVLALLFSSTLVCAQSPGGIAGSVLWLKANEGGSDLPLSWVDYSGFGNDFGTNTIGEPAFSPTEFNFNPGIVFDESKKTFMYNTDPIGFPTANDDRTVFVVANTTMFDDNYHWLFTYGNPGTPYGTFQFGERFASLATAFYSSDADFVSPGGSDYPRFWDSAQYVNGALATYVLSGNQQVHYDRAIGFNTGDLSAFTLTAESKNAVIGALDWTEPGETPTHVSSEYWTGSVGEIIMYPYALPDGQRLQVESYLALKYGISLGEDWSAKEYISSNGTVFWTFPPDPDFPDFTNYTFQHDIFGIGTDNGSGLVQMQSNSATSGSGDGTGKPMKGNIVIATSTPLDDQQFLMIGHDGGSLEELPDPVTSGVPTIAEGSMMIGRHWKVQNTNGAFPADLSLSFDINGLTYTGGTTASNYRLMIDPNGDEDFSDALIVKSTGFNGSRLTFGGATSPIFLANNVSLTIITQASAALLPATWQGFNVAQQANNAYLTWKTSEEVDVDYYTVEFSVNGTSFFSAGNVAARNSGGSAVNTYTFSQQNLPAGVRYYRIKRVDKNGQVGYTDIKSIRIGAQTSLILKSNPVTTGKLELNIEVAQNQTAEIRVVNTSGQIVLQQKVGLTNGSNSVLSNISSLTPGSYFLQVQLSNEILNRKFVKAH